ncbi:MAG: lysophospholipid acyltransferase family protein [Ardenticatenaceae bacterium]
MNSFLLSFRRRVLKFLAQACFALTARVTVTGLHHLPDGPALLAANHLHHIDSPLLVAILPTPAEIIALAERRKYWVTPIVHFYGSILVQRDEVDRSVLRAVLAALEQGKQVIIFPEARISRQGGLQEARDGVGYLALRANVPVVPIAISGSETILTAWREFRRPQITVTIAPPLTPSRDPTQPRRLHRKMFTHAIMSGIAAHLPPPYRGYYGNDQKDNPRNGD